MLQPRVEEYIKCQYEQRSWRKILKDLCLFADVVVRGVYLGSTQAYVASGTIIHGFCGTTSLKNEVT